MAKNIKMTPIRWKQVHRAVIIALTVYCSISYSAMQFKVVQVDLVDEDE